MRAAIFTICIGDEYTKQYETIFKPSVTQYCKKHGYDLVTVTKNIFDSTECISLMKHTIPFSQEARQYDMIMVLDADILINNVASPFHILDLGDKVGVVDEYSQPSYEERLKIQQRNGWEVSASEYYKLCSLEIQTKSVFNSGMFICKPAVHAPFFKSLVEKYKEGQKGHPRKFHFEQSVFGYELQKQNLYTILDNRWNCLWPLNSHSNYFQVYNNSFLLHMCGNVDIHKAYQLTLLLHTSTTTSTQTT
jgi:hypothetical protein